MEEETKYYRVIQKVLGEDWGWEMTLSEIEDFLEAKGRADVIMGSGKEDEYLIGG